MVGYPRRGRLGRAGVSGGVHPGRVRRGRERVLVGGDHPVSMPERCAGSLHPGVRRYRRRTMDRDVRFVPGDRSDRHGGGRGGRRVSRHGGGAAAVARQARRRRRVSVGRGPGVRRTLSVGLRGRGARGWQRLFRGDGVQHGGSDVARPGGPVRLDRHADRDVCVRPDLRIVVGTRRGGHAGQRLSGRVIFQHDDAGGRALRRQVQRRRDDPLDVHPVGGRGRHPHRSRAGRRGRCVCRAVDAVRRGFERRADGHPAQRDDRGRRVVAHVRGLAAARQPGPRAGRHTIRGLPRRSRSGSGGRSVGAAHPAHAGRRHRLERDVRRRRGRRVPAGGVRPARARGRGGLAGEPGDGRLGCRDRVVRPAGAAAVGRGIRHGVDRRLRHRDRAGVGLPRRPRRGGCDPAQVHRAGRRRALRVGDRLARRGEGRRLAADHPQRHERRKRRR